ncbi:hypothetical protein D3C80_1022190 [compost metagenome]
MEEEIDRYFAINAAIERSEKHRAKQKRLAEKSTRAYRLGSRVFWFGVVMPAVLSVLLAPIGLYEPLRGVFYVCWGLLFLSYSMIVLYPALAAWLYRASLKKAFTLPYSSLLDVNAKQPMQSDAEYLPQLIKLSALTLKLGMLELKSERNSFEKRTAMVVGPLEKIGIIPGILASFVGAQSVATALAGGAASGSHLDWIYALAGFNVLTFALCVFVQFTLVRYDRMIALTELAIDCKAQVGSGIGESLHAA